MRIALCLSGMPRTVHEGHKKLFDSFIKKYNPDIFIHTWLDNPHQGPWERVYTYEERVKQISDILSLYKPKSFHIDKSHIVQDYYKDYSSIFLQNNISQGATVMRYIYNPHSMYESNYLVNELKKKYENQNNFIYDYVVRTRMDVDLRDSINFEDIDTSYINIDNNKNPIYDSSIVELSEVFAVSSSKNMDIFADFTNKIRHVLYTLRDSPVKVYPELILARYVKLYNIKVKAINLNIIGKIPESAPSGDISTVNLIDLDNKLQNAAIALSELEAYIPKFAPITAMISEARVALKKDIEQSS